MIDKSTCSAAPAPTSRPEQVWELGNSIVELFSAAAAIATDLQSYDTAWDKKNEAEIARRAVDHISIFTEMLTGFKEQTANAFILRL